MWCWWPLAGMMCSCTIMDRELLPLFIWKQSPAIVIKRRAVSSWSFPYSHSFPFSFQTNFNRVPKPWAGGPILLPVSVKKRCQKKIFWLKDAIQNRLLLNRPATEQVFSELTVAENYIFKKYCFCGAGVFDECRVICRSMTLVSLAEACVAIAGR